MKRKGKGNGGGENRTQVDSLIRSAIVRTPNLCVELLQRIGPLTFVFVFLPGLCGICGERQKYDNSGSQALLGL